MNRGKRVLIGMALLTLLGFPALGFIANMCFGFVDTSRLFETHIGYFKEMLYGSLTGLMIALLGWKIVHFPLLKGAYDDIEAKIKAFHLSIVDIIFISLCAGIGEEILFRGFIQAFLGIWPTAIFFVAIHGYLRPDRWRRSIYGIYMTVAIAIIGYMKVYWGLSSAIAAHTIVDLVLFYLSFRNH